MASAPPLWGVHAAVPRTGEASPSVVQKPFREVGNGDSPSVSAQHISGRSHEKHAKAKRIHTVDPSVAANYTIYLLYDLSLPSPRIAKRTEHNFLELTFVILLITQNVIPCPKLHGFWDALISIAPDEAAFKKCNRTSFYSSLVCYCKSGILCVMDSKYNQLHLHLTNKMA